MRLVFCFSRSCKPYPTTLALRSLPCWPGAKLRFSIGHLSLKHLGPFRNNFMPSRRQRRHTGPLYRAIFLLTSDVDRFTELLFPSSRSKLIIGSSVRRVIRSLENLEPQTPDPLAPSDSLSLQGSLSRFAGSGQAQKIKLCAAWADGSRCGELE